MTKRAASYCFTFIVVVGLTSAFLCLSSYPVMAQRLERFEKVFEDKEDKKTTSDEKKDHGKKTFVSIDDDDDYTWFDWFDLVMNAYFTWPRGLVGDASQPMYFHSHPTWDDEGFVYSGAEEEQSLSVSGGWAYHHVSKSLRGHHGWMKARTSARWGFEAEGTWFDEDIESETDALSIFECRLINTAHGEKIFVDMGLGGKFLIGKNHRAGVDLGISTTWHPVRPLTVDAAMDFALVSGVWLRDFSVGIGASYKHVGVRAGFRSIWANDEDLSGPEIGIIFTF